MKNVLSFCSFFQYLRFWIDGICDDNKDNCEDWTSSSAKTFCCDASGDWTLVEVMVGLAALFGLVSFIVAAICSRGMLELEKGQVICSVSMFLAFAAGLVGVVMFLLSEPGSSLVIVFCFLTLFFFNFQPTPIPGLLTQSSAFPPRLL